MPSRSKLWAVSLLLTAFVFGAVVGGATIAAADRSDRGDRGSRRTSYIDRLQTELDLTAEQRAEVEQLIERRNEAVHTVWEESQRRYEEIRKELRAEITETLDEGQRTTYQQMIYRSDSIRAARRRHRNHDSK
jgi:Spy/CpxP family protein refolding chaperone